MAQSTLKAISPIDGRYFKATEDLSPFFSEMALMRYRVLVEIEYFIALCELPLKELKGVDAAFFEKLRFIYISFNEEDALRIKEIEKTTNHDVKAVEYFLKEKFDTLSLKRYKEFIHFALTSQDINNTALPLMIKEAQIQIIFPLLERLIAKISDLSKKWKSQPMLAFTHGQPASPTTMGKELLVFVERLTVQFNQLKAIPYSAKLGGATGNFNAHHVAYLQEDWIKFADNFINETLKLSRSKVTTQIEHYDNLAALCDAYKRINTILLDFCRDMWSYISMNYFNIAIKAGEVGSSAMPHKVNPIDFENAEGNIGLANAIFEHLSAKLPVSRLQRDLSDSTVTRNIGVPLAHTLIAIKSISKGLEKISINKEVINEDLNNNWAVVAEAIQTILRKVFYPEPYEKLKELTRTNEKITSDRIHAFIDTLSVSASIKEQLKMITPFNYTGIVDQFYK